MISMVGAAIAWVVAPEAGRDAARRRWIALGAISIGFHLWLVFSGLVPNLVARPLHLALALPWVLLGGTRLAASEGDDGADTGTDDGAGRDVGGRLRRLTGLLLAIVGVGACLWVAWRHDALADQYGYLDGAFQTAVAVALLAVTLEAARRAIGWPLPLVALAALGYAFLGEHVPGHFGHAGLPTASLLGTLAIAEGGLWGSLTGVSVGIVAVFVILGATLNSGEAGQGFMNLAGAAAGRLTGGAAKVSVLSSALFGSLSGSASANVASTGTVTLPTMARLGYPRAFAGAVEAVASSGGQIMPPLMGAGAFVMVELTGVPYTGIMAAASLPALLYFFAVWVGIDGFSRRHALRPLPAEERPSAGTVLRTAAFFAVPFAVLLLVMFALGRTPQYAAALAIGAGALLLPFDERLGADARRTAARLARVCLRGGAQIATIASIIVCASIVVGVLGATGLGVKMTSAIVALSGGSLWPALLLTALACLLLGMEVPTTAAYVVCVSVAGPALGELGLAPLQAHLFVFWFALLSTITPPVCGAVFIAAGMVGAPWLRVAGHAMALGIGLYLIPLAMIRLPALLAPVDDPAGAALALARVAGGLWLVSRAVIVPGAAWRRAAAVALGAALLFAGS